MESKTVDYFGLTKESIERPANEDEISYLKLRKNKLKNIEAEAEAKATARASALDKLAALGLSADEIAAL